MNVLSYRGPSSAGGVSTTLSRVFERSSREQWWFLNGTELRKQVGNRKSNEEVCQIPFKIIEGHYRYCNEFLWPIFHELPQYATFDETNRFFYQQLNLSYAWNVIQTYQNHKRQSIFVNDYQLALCPQFLAGSSGFVGVFWHIPWPKSVEDRFVPYLSEIAIGLLYAGKIGFHIEQYVLNFLEFVERHLSDYTVDWVDSQVIRPDGKSVKLVFRPLGIDSDYWMSKSKDESFVSGSVDVKCFSNKPFVLSVDRADYTKGVLERLQAVEHFFSKNAGKIGKVTFVQICEKTRSGLPAYDNYWQKCRSKSESINTRWSTEDWAPIVWIDTSVSANVLAWLYKRASVMLVTPINDGLNLTAKEFVLCSQTGVLILSARAGSWHELRSDVLTLLNLQPETISEQVAFALSLPQKSRFDRMSRLREAVLSNGLANWWQEFGGDLRLSEKVLPMSVKIHHSTREKAWIAK